MNIDPDTLSARRKFTIRCTADRGPEIQDGNGKKGGNFRGKKGKDLSWKNDTDEPVCYLQFTRIPDEDSAAADGPDWPFSGDEPPGLLLEVPQGSWTTRTLKEVEVTESFEYVVLGASKTPLLDPVIIIDPN
jgi:hypothetical protein